MNTAFALDYIPRRMKDLGHGPEYYTRPRHFVLKALETREVQANTELFMLIEENANVRIESDFALYDLSDRDTNEQSYEHQGTIRITNHSTSVTHLRFIQVIPKN